MPTPASPPAYALMGILNVTPDSFSDGGEWFDGATAAAHGRELIAQGATILDVGGESTRPGAAPVAAAEERARVVPVIEQLAGTGVQLSVDTTKAQVAARGARRGRGLRQRRQRAARRSGDGARGRRAGLRLLPDAHARRAAHDAGRPTLRRRRRRRPGLPDRAGAGGHRRRRGSASASTSTRASASARPPRTTSSCCGAWTRSSRSGSPSWSARAASRSSGASPAATIPSSACTGRSPPTSWRSSAAPGSSACTTSVRRVTRWPCRGHARVLSAHGRRR